MSDARILQTGLTRDQAVEAAGAQYTQMPTLRIAIIPPWAHEGWSVVQITLAEPIPVPIRQRVEIGRTPCYCDSAYHREGHPIFR